jgi:Ala-tRNA(Pro) deacylase
MDMPITKQPQTLLNIFKNGGFDFTLVEHSAVFTIDDALALVPPISGIKTKNVFARDVKGTRHFLIVVPHDKRIDLEALAKQLPSTKLSMGSADRLERCLDVSSGAVSIFALINDPHHHVELVVDEQVWQAKRVHGHPLRNTATVSIAHDSLAAFLQQVGHTPKVLLVPAKAVPAVCV